jgi:D-inositol-3-phosphate glycosyltransferase
MRRLLFIGDAACPSGFARSTHHLCDYLDHRANPSNQRPWEVTVLGLNYRGDPHKYAYDIYPASMKSKDDFFGMEMVPDLIGSIRPDVVVVQNDPWNFWRYMTALRNIPTIGIVAIDGKNVQGRALNGLHAAVFWTKFGADEAQKGGFTGPYGVVPLGVDLDVYKPMDKQEARKLFFTPDDYDAGLKDAFIVSNVNRNQPRKRFDLAISYFAEWIKSKEIRNAYLHLHVAPTGDIGYDCHQLAVYYGVANRLILSDSEVWKGVSESVLSRNYNIADVGFSCTQGEGWGLTTMEMMACGVPQIVPDYAALGEWPEDTVLKVRCSEIAVTTNRINIIGGIVDRQEMIFALDTMYYNYEMRADLATRGKVLVERPEYRWPAIGEKFNEVIEAGIDVLGVRVNP